MTGSQDAVDPHSPEHGGFTSFVEDCLLFDERMVTPTRFLWRAYLDHCRRWGFPEYTPAQFQRCAKAQHGIILKSHGDARGYIRSTCHGVCVRPR